METRGPERTAEELRRSLGRIDGHGYRAYQTLEGVWTFRDFQLVIDHVQGDPYAPPSRLRVQAPTQTVHLPRDLHRDRVRRIAVQDFLTRLIAAAIARHLTRPAGRVIGGLLDIDCGGQEVLDRSALRMRQGAVEARLAFSMPGAGRTVAAADAERVLCQILPQIVQETLVYERLPRAELKRFVEVVEDQVYLRRQLEENGLVAFVADGAVLPRRSGVDDRPLASGRVVPFAAPESLRVTLAAPNAGNVSGMGIRRGVTLVVGGGFHGKSTLLNAIERSVYNHVPGDGREQVVTIGGAVKIRAEDGRSVSNVDISEFIGELPGSIDTRRFSSANASGSTSQAANIVEAIEVGAECLLMDEDTCASNFMIRDERMQALVAKEREPIVPFIDRVRGLFERWGVSTVLVMGGSGDYFDVADSVIMMDSYRPRDRTREAQEVARRLPTGRHDEAPVPITHIQRRMPHVETIDPTRGRREVRIATQTATRMLFGQTELDLSAVSQLVDISQTRTIGEVLVQIKRRLGGQEICLAELLRQIARELESEGPDAVGGRPVGFLAVPRRFEIAAALNRLRGVKFRQLAPRTLSS
jgi:predicted ABC-class ATPase